MRIQRLPVAQSVGHVLAHNIVDATGRRVLRKGVQLTSNHIATLHKLHIDQIDVAVLAADDVGEDEAAERLVAALLSPQLAVRWGVGGRANLYTNTLGVLYVDGERLCAINELPGITLATAPQHAVVRPERGHDQVATLKIIPYAIPTHTLQQAVALANDGAPLLQIRPLRQPQVALLIVGAPAVHAKLRAQFEPPLRKRIERLGGRMAHVQAVNVAEAIIADAVRTLLPAYDLLIVAGQTSIMDADDRVLRALRAAGAQVDLHGAPVDPGNLLALAYARGEQSGAVHTPILCAPGCARSNAANVVDLVLPRLLVGERLTQSDIARMGLGGLLR